MVNQINKEMQKTVEWIQSLGYKTTDSGDGHTNKENGMEGTMDFPHVVIRIDNEINGDTDVIPEANYLWDIICDMGLDKNKNVFVEASYTPRDGVIIILVGGINDEIFLEARRKYE